MDLGDAFDALRREANLVAGEETRGRQYGSQRSFASEAEARAGFQSARRKLFMVNDWSNLPGISADFQLFDPQGAPKPSGDPVPGDYLRINLPGPLPENWVRVTDRREDKDWAEFTVQPSPRPEGIEGGAGGQTEHFFSEEARSTFRVEQAGNQLLAREIGTRERINNQGDEAGDRSLVNTLIAEGGWAFFQRVQWEKLTHYLIA